MTGFFIAAIVMIAICLGLAVVPLWRASRQGPADSGRREANIDAYYQRLRELDRELAAGRIDAASAAEEKKALGTRLVSDVDTGRTVPAGESAAGRPWLASASALCLILLAGTFGYYWLGNVSAIEQSGMPNIDELVGELAAQVEAQPDDRGARMMLAQAYESRGAYAKAAEQLAYINERAVPPAADLLAAEAQARLRAGQPLDGQPGALFQRALVQDPSNIAALWFLGLRAVKAGNDKTALRLWDRLLGLDLPPDVREMVQGRRKALAGELPSL